MPVVKVNRIETVPEIETKLAKNVLLTEMAEDHQWWIDEKERIKNSSRSSTLKSFEKGLGKTEIEIENENEILNPTIPSVPHHKICKDEDIIKFEQENDSVTKGLETRKLQKLMEIPLETLTR